MATAEQDTMASVERRRIELEENVAKLRQSLQHWENWGIEYEMLKEEIQNANDPSAAQISQIGRDLGGKLVNEKEVEEFLGKDQSTKRTANQVVDMISRRVDYVQKNITTIEKQLDGAEKKLSGVSVLLEPDMENEEGLPWMDIEEELDDEENVISGKTSQPGKAAPELVEILRKTGIKKAELEGLDDRLGLNGEPSSSTTPVSSTNGTTANSSTTDATPVMPKPTPPKATPSKKSVSFAKDTKLEPTPKPVAPPRPVYAMPAPEPKPAPPTTKAGTLETAGYNEALSNYNFTRGTKVVELDDDDNEIASYPIIPQDETPEAAELRRQMLQYGLSEVGAVVAEIDLERPTVEYSGDEDEDMNEDYDDDFDNYEDSEVEEEEDKFGRTTKRVITNDYKKQMMELEKKLNARMMENVGPREDAHPLAEHADDVRSLKILKDEAVDDLLKNAEPVDSSIDSKKGVRFADNLDVSPAPQSIKEPVEVLDSAVARKPTMADSIVERSGAAPQPLTAAASKPAKVSRFKSAKTSSAKTAINMLPPQPIPEPQPFPTGPSGQIVANEVIEKTTKPSDHQAPDEFDPIIVNRQIQAEYHKLRNTMINRQGGFMPDDDEKEDPLMEERNGRMKKVSRFMAARLKSEDL
jgi:unconventional prefoldin RPB5 interactor 1